MAYPSYVGASTPVTITPAVSTASITPNLPSGVSAGDRLVIVIRSSGLATAVPTMTPASGWTPPSGSNSGIQTSTLGGSTNALSMWTFTARYDAATWPPTFSTTASGNNLYHAQTFAWSPSYAVAEIVTGVSANSDAIVPSTWGSITTLTQPGTIAVFCTARGSTLTTFNSAHSFTEQEDIINWPNPVTSTGNLKVADLELPSGGAATAPTWNKPVSGGARARAYVFMIPDPPISTGTWGFNLSFGQRSGL